MNIDLNFIKKWSDEFNEKYKIGKLIDIDIEFCDK